MQYLHFISAVVFFTVILIAGAASPLSDQDKPAATEPLPVQIVEQREKTDWEIRQELYPARKTVQGRFGAVQFGSTSQSFDYSRQRLNGGAVFGSNNRFLGLDTMSPASRIRPQTVEEAAVIPQSAQNEPAKYKVAPSANTAAPAAVPSASSVRTSPMRKNSNFFDGITNEETPGETPENKLPIEQRWFRDIDAIGRNTNNSRMPQGIGNNRTADSGEAVAVGGVPDNVLPARSGTNPAAGLPPAARTSQFTVRNIERQLEEMILTSPGVHLLSPVQVSYQNGIATLRGVVANQQNKIEAGKILLNVQEVRQVNNQLTIVPLDPVRLPVIEAK